MAEQTRTRRFNRYAVGLSLASVILAGCGKESTGHALTGDGVSAGSRVADAGPQEPYTPSPLGGDTEPVATCQAGVLLPSDEKGVRIEVEGVSLASWRGSIGAAVCDHEVSSAQALAGDIDVIVTFDGGDPPGVYRVGGTPDGGPVKSMTENIYVRAAEPLPN